MRSRPVARDLDEQTVLGDVYLDGLRRAQLRLGLTVLGLMVLALGSFPLLLTLVPSTRTMTLAGAPLPWLVLGVLVYPSAWLLARGYVRQSERIEAEFRYWSDLEIRKDGEVTRTTGHGFAAFPRLRLLQVLSDRARELGAEVRFNETVEDATALDADIVVLADERKAVTELGLI